MRQVAQFERARMHFRKVMTLLDDPTERLYVRAQEELDSMGPG